MNSTVTLEKEGTVVLPKTLRDELRLQPGDTLEVNSAGSTISLRPVRTPTPLSRERAVRVFRAGSRLTADAANKAVRETREQRDRRSAG